MCGLIQGFLRNEARLLKNRNRIEKRIMMKNKKLIIRIVTVVLVLILAYVGKSLNPSEEAVSDTEETLVEMDQDESPVELDETVTNMTEQEEVVLEEEEILYPFRTQEQLTDHYERHGIEMGYDTEESYVAGANGVVLSPDALHKLEEEDGDFVYYLEETNEFVVLSPDGYIRTYFCPDDGIDYYNRQ